MRNIIRHIGGFTILAALILVVCLVWTGNMIFFKLLITDLAVMAVCWFIDKSQEHKENNP
jgi:hypothetical protein